MLWLCMMCLTGCGTFRISSGKIMEDVRERQIFVSREDRGRRSVWEGEGEDVSEG